MAHGWGVEKQTTGQDEYIMDEHEKKYWYNNYYFEA